MHCIYLSADPEDYSSAVRYNVTFRQTVLTDIDNPNSTALSSPIVIDIVSDYVFEGMEYFQAHIVETSDAFRVRIGQGTVNVTITDSESLALSTQHIFLRISLSVYYSYRMCRIQMCDHYIYASFHDHLLAW